MRSFTNNVRRTSFPALAGIFAQSLFASTSPSDGRQHWRGWLTGMVLLFCSTLAYAQASPVVARVNGQDLTAARLQLMQELLGISDEEWPARKEEALSQLIDRLLIQQFLDSRKVSAPASVLETQKELVEQILASEKSPEQKLSELGLTRAQLQKELALPLAWNRYVQQVVTDQQVTEYFQTHRSELDGTKRRAAQIFLKQTSATPADERQKNLQQLKTWRSQIQAGELSFAQAAKKYSQAPSASQGGTLGAFTYFGQMPSEISQAAFNTPVGALSEPFESPFGVHLLQVTEEIPGQFSLEDVRRDILARLSQQLWDENVARLKKTARIETIEN